MATRNPEKLYVGERRSDLTPLPRKAENSAVQSPTLLMFVLIAMVGVLAYTIFLFDPANRGDLLPYALVIIAEVILISQAVVSMWTVLSGGLDPRDVQFHNSQERLYDTHNIKRAGLDGDPEKWPMLLDERPVSVDVFITVYGEDPQVIRRTAQAAQAMRGAHTTWILDDGRSDDIRQLAEDLGVRYVRRLSNNGAKAGNVNHALTLSNAEYFAIFDADFVPKADFLFETVPFFIDDNVAFVQTPQAYGNMHNMISRGAGYMQALFYRFVQPGRNSFNAAFCVGTNVIFRRLAIDDVGGMYTDSKSEDVWTSYMLHERGWRSVYIPVTLAIGNAPETIEDYTKQQMRWATGGFEILLTRSPLNPKRKLTVDQRIQYFVTATHYLVGIVPLLLILVPPLEIFFDLRPVNLTVTWFTWVLFYFGFYGLQVMLAFNTMGSFRPETLMLASVSFPIYLRALINVISGREQAWHVTGSRRKRASPFNFMIPQVLLFVFLGLTSMVGVYKDYSNGVLTLATAWNLTNTFVLASFMVAGRREVVAARRARREERRTRRAQRRTSRRPQRRVVTAGFGSSVTPASAPVASMPMRTEASAPAFSTNERSMQS